MTEIMELQPGITLRCYPDHRFKHSCLSFQIVRPMQRQEVALNALLPAVLLRGTRQHPDLRSITFRLDDLYGAAAGTLCRRVGDYQTTGIYCSFIEDKYAMPGDRVLEPMIGFLGELLLDSLLEDGAFHPGFVESEKKNLISTIEAELNDKRGFAMGQMLKIMCREDSYGIPRLGEPEQVAAITPRMLYDHYRKILRESPIDVFYVGSAPAQQVKTLLQKMLQGLERDYRPLPEQTPFCDVGGEDATEQLDVVQGQLCLGYTTPITNRSPQFAAMQVMNSVFGSGMTSKLFMNVREKLSLCYAIHSTYYGSKGIVTVGAGIDFANEEKTRAEIQNQLSACQAGDISPEELAAAKESMLSSLRGTHDSPGAIEGYYATMALSGLKMDPDAYMQAISDVTISDVVAAAGTVKLHTSYFLKGVNP